MPSQSTYAIQDAQFTTSVALGDNASTTRGNGLDLGSATPFPVTQRVTVQIVTTAGNHALPPSTLRFIRAICVTESSGGNASNGTATLKVLF